MIDTIKKSYKIWFCIFAGAFILCSIVKAIVNDYMDWAIFLLEFFAVSGLAVYLFVLEGKKNMAIVPAAAFVLMFTVAMIVFIRVCTNIGNNDGFYLFANILNLILRLAEMGLWGLLVFFALMAFGNKVGPFKAMLNTIIIAAIRVFLIVLFFLAFIIYAIKYDYDGGYVVRQIFSVFFELLATGGLFIGLMLFINTAKVIPAEFISGGTEEEKVEAKEEPKEEQKEEAPAETTEQPKEAE